MENSYQKLIRGNQIYSETKLFQDPEYFQRLSQGQKPDYLWIGCSDSRVPANEITKTESGEIFVHRNIANLVVHTDSNLLSVLEYAVKFLGVKHIIVCGHYGCGGVKAAMTNTYHGHVDNWLRNIKDVYYVNREELEAIPAIRDRENRLTELNVIEQVKNLAKTTIVQQAWAERELHLHGWVYGLHDGLINDLSVIHNCLEDVSDIYRFDIKPGNSPEGSEQHSPKALGKPGLSIVPVNGKVAQEYSKVKKASVVKAISSSKDKINT